MEIKIGSDPEIWIMNNATGKIISAHGLFPGTKDEPYKVKHGAIQVDGMAAEYNILPASTAEEFVFYHLSVLCDLRDEIKARNPELDFSFVFTPVADFGAEYIAEQPLEARQLGCTPDFNAWEDGAVNPTPDAEMPFRTASGHIHIGWGNDYDIDDPEHIEACCMMVKQLDAQFACSYALLEGDDGARRRELYGKAGAFRPKKYGVEWRVLSNCWLSNTYYMRNVFRNVKEAFENLLGGYKMYEHPSYAQVRKWLDENNVKKMEYFFGRFEVDYRADNQPVTMETLDKLREQWERKAGINAQGEGFRLVAIDEMDNDDFAIIEDDQPEIDDEPEEWALVDIDMAELEGNIQDAV